MKKAVSWILFAAILVMVITWGVVGLDIINGDYDSVTPGAWIVLVCLIVCLVCIFCRRFSSKCPNCGKTYEGSGEYCSHCGKKKE